MTLQLTLSILQIILIDVVLSGDNAVVIAMAAHKLPEHQRKRAILWGGGIAIVLRIIFTMIMSFLLMVPWLRLFGGLLLVWIACKLLRDEEEEEVTADSAGRSTIAAIKMIFLADFAMSLDNMLAVAGASHGNWKLLLGGLVISIAIIMTCSNLIASLMNRYHWIVTLGGDSGIHRRRDDDGRSRSRRVLCAEPSSQPRSSLARLHGLALSPERFRKAR